MSSNRPEVRPTAKLGGPDVASQRREDYWSITIRQFKKNRIAVLGVVLILALFVVAVGADFYCQRHAAGHELQRRNVFPCIAELRGVAGHHTMGAAIPEHTI